MLNSLSLLLLLISFSRGERLTDLISLFNSWNGGVVEIA